MLFKYQDNLVLGRESTIIDENGFHHQAVILRDGVQELIVDTRNKDLVESERQLVSFTHTIPVSIKGAGQHREAIIDSYMQQAAMITKHGLVPIPTFDDETKRDFIDPLITLEDSVGWWEAAVVDSAINEQEDSIILNISLIGSLFKEIIDPDNLINETNVSEMLVVKLFFRDVDSDEVFPEESPYLCFTVGVANQNYLVERTIMDGLAEEAMDAGMISEDEATESDENPSATIAEAVDVFKETQDSTSG